jgi:hypothetical protein
MPVEPLKNSQNLNCLKIHPANSIRLAYTRNKLWLRQYIGGVIEKHFVPALSIHHDIAF